MLTMAHATYAPLTLAWFQTWEIVLIVLAILLLFGGRKLPELARGLGRSLRIFKSEMQGVKDEVDDAIRAEPQEPKSKSTEPKAPQQKSEPSDDQPAG